MNPLMIIFFMFYNFIMPKLWIIFPFFYFLYAYQHEHFLPKLNTWFGFFIAIVIFFILHLLINEKIFKITYRNFMNKTSDIEPFVAFMISIFITGILSVIFSINILDYIITLKIF